MLCWSLLHLKSINSGIIYLFWKFACHLQVQWNLVHKTDGDHYRKLTKLIVLESSQKCYIYQTRKHLRFMKYYTGRGREILKIRGSGSLWWRDCLLIKHQQHNCKKHKLNKDHKKRYAKDQLKRSLYYYTYRFM